MLEIQVSISVKSNHFNEKRQINKTIGMFQMTVKPFFYWISQVQDMEGNKRSWGVIPQMHSSWNSRGGGGPWVFLTNSFEGGTWGCEKIRGGVVCIAFWCERFSKSL